MFLKNYVEEFKRVVINIKERKQDTNQAFQASNSTNTLSSQQNKSSSNNGAEDWESFRHFVRIIQIVGELIIKYEALEVTIEKKIQEIFLHSNQKTNQLSINSLSNDLQTNLLSVYNFKEYFLNDSDRLKLNRLISVIESGLI